MDLRRTPTHKSDHSKNSRARMCSLSAYGKKSPVEGSFNDKKAV
jgi:hypothetical protein